MAQGQHGWYTPEYKMEVVQKYLSDNYKVEPFCREIGISKSTFYQWLRIYTESSSNTEVLPTTSFQDVTPIIKQEPNIQNINIKLTLNDGIIPSNLKDNNIFEEERRLLYVGITRAKEFLYLSSAEYHFINGIRKKLRPSIFMTEIK